MAIAIGWRKPLSGVLFLPASRKRPYEAETPDRSNLLMRSEVLNKIQNTSGYLAVVTYPEALAEKVTDRITVGKNTLKVSKGDQLTLEFMTEFLAGMEFERVDFVAEPGQYAVRGGIVDVFSFSNDHPFRIEFFGNEIESIRSFDPGNQLSLSVMQSVSVMPDVQSEEFSTQKIPFTSYIPKDTLMWFDDLQLTVDRIAQGLEKAKRSFNDDTSGVAVLPESLYISSDQFLGDLLTFSVVEFGGKAMLDAAVTIQFDADPQPSFNKNFDLLINNCQFYFRCKSQTGRTYSCHP